MTTFGSFWVVLILLTLAVGALEGERWWTRMQRRQGQSIVPIAYILDGLAILFGVLWVFSVIALVINILTTGVMFTGSLITGVGNAATQQPSALIGPLVALLFAALVVRYILQRRRGTTAPKPRAPAQEAHETPVVRETKAPKPAQTPKKGLAQRLGIFPNTPVYRWGSKSAPNSSLGAGIAGTEDDGPVELVPSMAMGQQRRRFVQTPNPHSFLDLASPDSARRRKRKLRWGRVLVLLILIAAVGSYVGRDFLPVEQQLVLEQTMDVAQTTVSGWVSSARAMVSGRQPNGPAGAVGVVPTVPATTPAGQATSVAPTATPEVQNTGQVTKRVTRDVNLRAGPSRNQAVVTTLSRGTTVTVISEIPPGVSDAWVKVRSGSLEGWVSLSFLE